MTQQELAEALENAWERSGNIDRGAWNFPRADIFCVAFGRLKAMTRQNEAAFVERVLLEVILPAVELVESRQIPQPVVDRVACAGEGEI